MTTPSISKFFLCCAAAIAFSAHRAAAGTLYYAFEDSTKKGGLARVQIDDATGALTAHETLWIDLLGATPNRLVMNDAGDRALVVRDVKDGFNLLVFDVTQPKVTPIQLEFGSRPDSVTVKGDLALVTGTRGRVVAIDLRAGKVTATFDGRKGLVPAAAKSDLVTITEDGKKAIVSFQTDGDDGKEKGHRLIVLDLPTLTLAADLVLPRDQATLHPTGVAKDAGPGPEVIVTAARSNTLMVTLDIYGAVALVDLDQALAGKWSNPKVLSTALDSTLGTAFPDRALVAAVGDKEFGLAFNAGSGGGLAVVDLTAREVIHRVACPYGLDLPVYLTKTNSVVLANCGKMKTRTATGITKDKVATDQLVVVDLAPLATGAAPKVASLKASTQVHKVHPLDPANSAIIALLLKTRDGSRVAAFDVANGKEVGVLDAFGRVRASAVVATKTAAN
jgi:hypothetical protein